MSRRVAVVTLWPPRCITPYFLIFVIISKRVVAKGKRRYEVAQSRSLRSVQKSVEKKRRKTGFSRLGQNREHSIAIGLRPVTEQQTTVPQQQAPVQRRTVH